MSVSLLIASAGVEIRKTPHFFNYSKSNKARMLKLCTVLALVLGTTYLKPQSHISIQDIIYKYKMCAEDNFYLWGAILLKTGWKYAMRAVNHKVELRTA